MTDSVLELAPGQILKITYATPIVIGRWPWPPFGIEFDKPQIVYFDPALSAPFRLTSGLARLTNPGVLHVYAVYENLTALLVFPYPAMWVNGDTARLVALAEK